MFFDKKKPAPPCPHPQNPCGPDVPGFCPPPQPPTPPCVPPVPSVVEGSSLYEAMNTLADRVNLCINTYNNVMANCYETLHNLERAAEENGAYYGPCEVWTEQGYYADESATYTLIHKAPVDRRGEPIRIELHLAYGNTTNSRIEQSLSSASMVTLADKILVAQPMGANGWYGNAIWHGAPIPAASAPTLYTMGFTKSGVMRVYSNAVDRDQMLRDTVTDAMGVSGVLIQNGEITDTSWMENIPSYDLQATRVCVGQNLATREVIFLTTAYENDVNKKGMTSQACAAVLRNYGCDIAVELCEGVGAAAMDKGSLIFTPANDTIPNAYCFWYISRKCHYKTDYTRELAELVQNYGACVWQGYLNGKNVEKVQNNLDAEIERAKQAEAALNAAIEEETKNRQEADAALNSAIEQETADRQAQDKLLNDAITQEISDRQAADAALNEALSQEITNRQEADSQINAALAQEVTDRQTADTALNNALEAETARATQKETQLQTAIDTEVHDRTNADAVLHQEILTEQGARIAADETLQQNINAEASSRAQADAVLQQNIDNLSSTVTTLENSVSGLQTQYNNLQTQVTAQDASITAIQNTVSKMDTAMANMETEIENIRQAVDDIATNVADEIEKEIEAGTITLPYLQLAGGTMTGNITMGAGAKITGVTTPTAGTDAASKEYVDSVAAGASYTLPPATSSTLGGIIVGDNLSVDGAGRLSAEPSSSYVLPPATEETLGGVKIGANVNVTDDGTISVTMPQPYTLPPATSSTLGGIIVGDNLSVDGTGRLSAEPSSSYVLPAATEETLGGVKIGENVNVSEDGTISVTMPQPYTLPIATQNSLGGVKIGANIQVTADGIISTHAPYTLPIATGETLGGIKPGANLSVNGEGVLTGNFLPLSGGTMAGDVQMGGHQVTGLGTPTDDADAATKGYVDGKYTYSTTDLEAGVSPLETGKLYFVYE